MCVREREREREIKEGRERPRLRGEGERELFFLCYLVIFFRRRVYINHLTAFEGKIL